MAGFRCSNCERGYQVMRAMAIIGNQPEGFVAFPESHRSASGVHPVSRHEPA